MRTPSHSIETLPASRVPSGPKGLPILGSFLDAIRDPLGLFERTRAEHGDIALFRFGPFRYVLVNDPDDVQHVLVANHRNYVKSRSYRGLALVLGQGLVTSEGDLWRRQRKLSQPAFHHQRLAGLVDKMSRCTNEMLEDWSGRPQDGELDVHGEMMRLTLRIVGHTLFSTELADDASELGPAITVALVRANQQAEAFAPTPLWIPTPLNLRFRRAKRILDATVHRIIAERRADGGDRGDLLSMLMAATDETGAGGMSDAQLRDEVMTLFLAGHETIATAMSWTWLLLSRHPDVAHLVREEASAVLGGRAARADDLPRLVYTGWVVDECMRLFPPVWVMERAALDRDEIAGYEIPRGWVVGVSPWTLHRHPDHWEQPERFWPERFSSERSEARHKHVFLPFGAGPRVCIGNHFAKMEAKVILATVAQRFAVEVPHTPRPQPGVTLRPNGGMRGRLHAHA
jgi:cytochrome P450